LDICSHQPILCTLTSLPLYLANTQSSTAPIRWQLYSSHEPLQSCHYSYSHAPSLRPSSSLTLSFHVHTSCRSFTSCSKLSIFKLQATCPGANLYQSRKRLLPCVGVTSPAPVLLHTKPKLHDRAAHRTQFYSSASLLSPDELLQRTSSGTQPRLNKAHRSTLRALRYVKLYKRHRYPN
jgi:putative component of membrane protein insertase Oxa1/YidC/SpoIIIJ protein YidD